MKYRIFKHTFEMSDLDANNKLTIDIGTRRFVKWLDAKPNAHKIDVWFVVDDAPVHPTPKPRLMVQGTGWLFEPHCATRHIATVRTPADYVWHLFGETAGLEFEEAGL